MEPQFIDVTDEYRPEFIDVTDEYRKVAAPAKEGSALGAFAETISRVPENLLAQTIAAFQGQTGASVTDRGYLDNFYNWVDERNRELSEKYRGTGDVIPGIISKEDLAQLGPNLAFSGVSLLGTAAGGLLGAPVPGGAIAGGLAGGGIAAHRMQSYQVMNEWLNKANIENLKKTGKPINPAEEADFRKQFESLATESGLWEAGPEAVGNVLELALMFGKGSTLGRIASLVPKGVAGKVLKAIGRTAGIFGTEEVTEAVTEMGQKRAEAKLTGEPMREWTSYEDWLKSAKEVLPGVLLLTGFMSGAGKAYRTLTQEPAAPAQIPPPGAGTLPAKAGAAPIERGLPPEVFQGFEASLKTGWKDNEPFTPQDALNALIGYTSRPDAHAPSVIKFGQIIKGSNPELEADVDKVIIDFTSKRPMPSIKPLPEAIKQGAEAATRGAEITEPERIAVTQEVFAMDSRKLLATARKELGEIQHAGRGIYAIPTPEGLKQATIPVLRNMLIEKRLQVKKDAEVQAIRDREAVKRRDEEAKIRKQKADEELGFKQARQTGSPLPHQIALLESRKAELTPQEVERLERIKAIQQPPSKEEIVQPGAELEGKRLWEMTRVEFAKNQGKDSPYIQQQRDAVVKQAIKRGLPVPPEVLKDYPDLVLKEADQMSPDEIRAEYKKRNTEPGMGSWDLSTVSAGADRVVKTAQRMKPGEWKQLVQLSPKDRRGKRHTDDVNDHLKFLRSIGYTQIAWDKEGNAYHALKTTSKPDWLYYEGEAPWEATERKAPITKGPQNLITYIQSLGGIDPKGSWGKELREFPDLKRVMKKGALPPDSVASSLNAEGWVNPSGGEWTDDILIEHLKSGQGRNIFSPEKSDAMIERQIRRLQREYEEQFEGLSAEELNALSREDKSGIKSVSLDEVASEEGLTESERHFADQDADDFFSGVKEGVPDYSERVKEAPLEKRIPRIYEEEEAWEPPFPKRKPKPRNFEQAAARVKDKPWEWTLKDLADLRPSERRAKLEKIWGPEEEFDEWFDEDGPYRRRHEISIYDDLAADLDTAVKEASEGEIKSILAEIQTNLDPWDYYAYEEAQGPPRQESLKGLTEAETFELAPTETQMGKLQPKDRGPQTAGMFPELEGRTQYSFAPTGDQKWHKSILRKYGSTNDIREGGYILPSGMMIDLSGKREGGPSGIRALDHREVGGTEGMQEFMLSGAIRMDGNSGAIDLVAAPTNAQKEVILKIARTKRGEIALDLWDGLGEKRETYYLEPQRNFSNLYLAGTNPYKILDDIETFYSGKGVRYSFAPFYSQFSKAVEAKMGGKMPVDQLKRMLKGQEVTDAEIENLIGGLSGIVTKQQVQDEIKVNSTEFQDVVLGEDSKERQSLVAELGAIKARAEMRPRRGISGSFDYGDEVNRVIELEEELAANPPSRGHFSQYVEPGAIPGTYREMFVTAPEKREGPKDVLEQYDQGFISFQEAEDLGMKGTAYWRDGHPQYSDIQNPIVRIRYNEREVDGKRILFVEEIQGPSDANQSKMPEHLRKRIYDIGVKRVLALAKEQGFDGVAWTPGEMQADRYDLSKQIQEVTIKKWTDTNKTGITFLDNNGLRHTAGEFRDNELEGVVGKDLAGKIITDLPRMESQEARRYSGLDLKVGGEGLKDVYDVRLPKLFKSYGKEAVGEVALDSGELGGVKMPNGYAGRKFNVPYIPITEKTPAVFTQYTTATGPAHTLEDVKNIFKNQEVIQSGDNFYIRTGKNYLTIESVNYISGDEVDFQIAYGIKFDKEKMQITGSYTTGAYGEAVIRLTRGLAGNRTLAHESAHYMEEMGIINDTDVTILKTHIKDLVRTRKMKTANKQDIGGSEDRASFIADNLDKPQRGFVKRVMLKIQTFLDRIMEAFGKRTAGAVVRDIETGRVFEREARPVTKGGGMAASVATYNEAVKTMPKSLVGSFDPLVHKNFNDLRDLAQHEIDLYEEGEETDIGNKKQLEAVRHWMDSIGKEKGTIQYSIKKILDNPEPYKKAETVKETPTTPEGITSAIRQQADFYLQEAVFQLTPEIHKMSGFKKWLTSPEFYPHPVLARIVRHFVRDRNEIFHENLNHFINLDDPNELKNTVWTSAKTLKYKGLSWDQIIKDESSKEYEDLKKLLLEADRDRVVYTEENLKRQNFSEDTIKVWGQLRESYDKALDALTQQLRDAIAQIEEEANFRGTKADFSPLYTSLQGALMQMEDLRGSFIPRIRQGEWAVQANRPQTEARPEKSELYSKHVGSHHAAARLKQKLEKEGWKNVRIEEVSKLPESVYQDLKTASVVKTIEAALEKMEGPQAIKFNEDLLRHVADEIKARGFRSHMIRRGEHYVKGFIEDPLEQNVIYMTNLSRGLAKAVVAQRVMEELHGTRMGKEKFGGIDPKKEPEVYTLAKDYIDEQLRNLDRTDRLIGWAKSIATLKFMGFSVRAALVNSTAIVTTSPPAIHQHVLEGKGSMIKVMRYLTDAGKDTIKFMHGGKLPADDMRFLQEEQKKGWDDPQYTRDMISRMGSMENRAWTMTMDAAMYMFGSTERWNRMTTMLAGYRLGRKQGLSHEEAAERAKTASDKSQGIYGRETLPAFAWGRNPAAKVAQMLYVYGKFSHTYLQHLHELGMKKNTKAFLYQLLAPMVISGAAAFPFADVTLWPLIGMLLTLAGLKDKDEDAKKWFWDATREHLGQKAETTGRFGLAGSLGLDISGSLSIGVGVPRNAWEWAGAPGGAAKEIYEAWPQYKKGNIGRALEHLAPAGAKNILKAIREAKEGMTTERGFQIWNEGKPMRPTTAETLLRMGGFRSGRQATASERLYEAKSQAREFDNQRDQIYEEFRAYLTRPGTREDYKKIQKKVIDYKKKRRDLKLREIPDIDFSEMRQRIKKQMQKPTKRIREMTR